MFKITLVTVAVGLGVVYGPATPAQAETCGAHIAKRGTTAAADIEYHRIHGGESPCKGSNDTGVKFDNGDNGDYNSRYHDDFGVNFGCGWRGCGWG